LRRLRRRPQTHHVRLVVVIVVIIVIVAIATWQCRGVVGRGVNALLRAEAAEEAKHGASGNNGRSGNDRRGGNSSSRSLSALFATSAPVSAF